MSNIIEKTEYQLAMDKAFEYAELYKETKLIADYDEFIRLFKEAVQNEIDRTKALQKSASL